MFYYQSIKTDHKLALECYKIHEMGFGPVGLRYCHTI